jgi:iron(II)-dependent oxidoreductase
MVPVRQLATSVDDQYEALASTRTRTLALIGGLSESELSTVVDPLLSPLIWDLGHIARFEQLWLLEDGARSSGDVYDPFENPRSTRGDLALMSPEQCLEQLERVRGYVVERLDSFDPMLVELVIQHEQQHNETMLQLLRQLDGYVPPAELTDQFTSPVAAKRVRLRDTASRAYRRLAGESRWIGISPGNYLIGADQSGPLTYDNERGAHRHPIGGFEIAARPVTCAEYAEWIAAGGYQDRTAWSVLGWTWLTAQGPGFSNAPGGWWLEDGIWMHGGFGPPRPVDFSAPVCHLSWFEADAYARAHDARLPTEFEWEVAAAFDAGGGADSPHRRFPWGDQPWRPGMANLDQLAFGTVTVGSFEGGPGPVDMLGQVWEWTSSEFSAYPGYSPFAYADYSQPFFDSGFRVLRGGSWATRARSVSNHFRNWELPQRRQLFAGLRLARDPQWAAPA